MEPPYGALGRVGGIVDLDLSGKQYLHLLPYAITDAPAGIPSQAAAPADLDRADASSTVTAGATANTTEGNSRASRKSGLVRSHSHGESIALHASGVDGGEEGGVEGGVGGGAKGGGEGGVDGGVEGGVEGATEASGGESGGGDGGYTDEDSGGGEGGGDGNEGIGSEDGGGEGGACGANTPSPAPVCVSTGQPVVTLVLFGPSEPAVEELEVCIDRYLSISI